jgi:hypothetical protein
MQTAFALAPTLSIVVLCLQNSMSCSCLLVCAETSLVDQTSLLNEQHVEEVSSAQGFDLALYLVSRASF